MILITRPTPVLWTLFVRLIERGLLAAYYCVHDWLVKVFCSRQSWLQTIGMLHPEGDRFLFAVLRSTKWTISGAAIVLSRLPC